MIALVGRGRGACLWCALFFLLRLTAASGGEEESHPTEETVSLLAGGAAEIGFVIPFSYGAQLSDQYRQALSMHWSIGPLNLEWWKFDLALEGDFFTGAGRDAFSFLIQPLVGSFTAAIRFTPFDGFYLEYVHNSAHTLQPLAPPTVAGLNYYPAQYTSREVLGLVGLLDVVFVGLRSRLWDLAVGAGRKNAFSAVDGVLLPFYRGADSGPMVLSLFSYDVPALFARARFDWGWLQLSLLHVNGFHLFPRGGRAYMKLSAQEGVNKPGRMSYTALTLALAPLYLPPYHTIGLFVTGGVSYALYDDARQQVDFAPLWHGSVGLNYRLLVPGVKWTRAGKLALTIYDNGEGQPLP